MIKTFLLAILFAFSMQADAKSIFGCDFSDCTSAGVPTIGGGGSNGSGGGSGSGSGGEGGSGGGATGAYRYDSTLESYIDLSFERKGSTHWEVLCDATNPRCQSGIVEVIGNRDLVVWTYELNPYSFEQGLMLFNGRSSDYNTRFGDAAALAPPNNVDQTRCMKNCDNIQKIESNTCNLHAAGIKVGGYVVGVLGGIAITPVATTAAGSTVALAPAAPAIGVSAGIGTGKIIVDATKDFSVAWNDLCQALAGQRQNDCYTGTCKFTP